MAEGDDRSDLARSRARCDTMAEYDRLAPALRRWLAGAKMQWSPVSARRAWRRSLWRSWGREAAALRMMDALEQERLARDALVRGTKAAQEAGGDPAGGDAGA